MSGREHEPIAAFFPSIDRNLIRDLDRHLRHASPPPSQPESERDRADVTEPEPTARLASTSDILEAVDQAAAAISGMQTRIQDLESQQFELETTNTQLKTKLSELLQAQQAAELAARADRDRIAQAEEIALQHQSRAEVLERDLETALGDLQRIAAAITGALGSSTEQNRR